MAFGSVVDQNTGQPTHLTHTPQDPNQFTQYATTNAGLSGLQYGMKNDAVAQLQRQLNKLGYNTGGVDGIFGNGTLSAVRDFQRSRGLSDDGVVGKNTLDALSSGAPILKPTPPAQSNSGGSGGGNLAAAFNSPSQAPAAAPAAAPAPAAPAAPASPVQDTITQLLQSILNGNNLPQSIQDQLKQFSQEQANQQITQQQSAQQQLIDEANNQLQSANQHIDANLADQQNQLNNRAFQDYLTARQQMADRGLAGSGLASDQDTRLMLNKQQQMEQLFNQANAQKGNAQDQATNAIQRAQDAISQLNPQATADKLYQSMYQNAMSDLQKNQTTYADLLKTLMPYGYTTADAQAALQNKMYADLGFMPDPNHPGQFLPTLDATKTADQAQHWANQDSLANAKLDLSQQQFQEKSQHDQAMMQYYQDNIQNASNKNQAQALLDELSHVSALQNTTYNSTGKLDPSLQHQQQDIMAAIASLYGNNTLTQGSTSGK